MEVADWPAPMLAGVGDVAVTENDGEANCALTVWLVSIVIEHAPVPSQPPVQPTKSEPAVGCGVSVTSVSGANDCEQDVPQLIPVGVLVTEPAPAFIKVLETLRTGLVPKMAMTCLSADIFSTQGPVPLQAPSHPEKTVPLSGVAISVTWLPLANDAEQLLPLVPQVIPATSLVIVPVALPIVLAVRMKGPANEPPDRVICCGLQFALSVKVRAALRGPELFGVNTTVTRQDSPPARLAVHVLLPIEKSPAFAPEIEMLLNAPTRRLSPLLMVRVSGALELPTAGLPKLKPDGLH